MICARCDKPIKSGQKYTTAVKLSISAGGYSFHVHEKCPRRPPFIRRTPS